MRGRRTRVVGVSLGALLLMALVYPTQRLSSTVTTGTFSGYRAYARAAPFTNGFVAVWQDGRFGSPTTRVFAGRISSVGTPLDIQGIQIANLPSVQADPAVSCIGTSCLIAWQQSLDGVYLRTFDAATGTVGTMTALQQPGQGALFPKPDIANDGTRFFVVWDDNVGGGMATGVRGQFVSTAGTLIGGTVQLSGQAYTSPRLAYGNGRYFLVNTRYTTVPDTVFGSVYDTNGVLQGAERNLGQIYDRTWPAMAVAMPTNFVAVWGDQNRDLTLRRVSTTGTLVDAAVVHPLGVGSDRHTPMAAFDGSNLAVGWLVGDYEIHGARFTPTLTVASPESVLVARQPDSQVNPQLSLVSGTQGLMTWFETDWRTFNRHRSQFLVSTDAGLSLSASGDVPVVLPDLHDRPAVAAIGQNFSVSFYSWVNNTRRNWVQPVSAVGQPLGNAVALGSTTLQEFAAAMVSLPNGGARILWSETSNVLSAPLDSAGLPATTQTLGTGFNSAGDLTMATLGGRVTAVWTGETPTTTSIFVRQIDVDGGVMGSNFTSLGLSPSNFAWFTKPHLAASASNYGLIYFDGNSPMFVRLTSAGALLGTPTAVGPRGINGDIASDGTNYLVVWSDTTEAEVHARRYNGATGAAIDVGPIELALYTSIGAGLENAADPKALFDGTSYVVSWADVARDGGGFDVARQRLYSDGGLGPYELVGGGPGDQVKPAMALGAQGQVLHAWLSPDFSLSSPVNRVFGAVISPTAIDAGAGDGGLVDSGVADSGVLDAGVTDSGVTDAGLLDAGSFDAGTVDAGGVDAGAPDSGVTDAGLADAGGNDAGLSDGGGTQGDGGSLDGGPIDGGELDAGLNDGGSDAGLDDGGATDAAVTDAGTGDGGVRGPGVYAVGCGCQSSSPASLLWLLALVMLRRWRR